MQTVRTGGDVKDYPTWPNLPAMMFALARTWPDKPLLRGFRNGAWHSILWGEFGRMAASCARHLRAAGVAAGDRVMIVSENRPEYPIAETALMALRAVPVPTYVTNTAADHAHILRDSGARAAIVSTPALAGALREAGRQAGGLDLLVVIEGPPEEGGASPRLMHWGALVADDAPPDDIALEAAAIAAGALACLIYTSGTGGAPKGVMLPHRSILSNCRGAFELLRPLRLKDEIYLSYLPTSHSYEHTVGQLRRARDGAERQPEIYARTVGAAAAPATPSHRRSSLNGGRACTTFHTTRRTDRRARWLGCYCDTTVVSNG